MTKEQELETQVRDLESLVEKLKCQLAIALVRIVEDSKKMEVKNHHVCN